MTGFFGHGNEHSGSIRDGELVASWTFSQFLNTDCAPRREAIRYRPVGLHSVVTDCTVLLNASVLTVNKSFDSPKM